jgi:aspartate/methionine/tyrosine aminotransferase
MGRASTTRNAIYDRPAFWAPSFTSAGSRSAPQHPLAATRALTSLYHPQAFGNYFTYGAAVAILGLDPRAPFTDGSMRLAKGYSDFGYMWSQLGPPNGAFNALSEGLSASDIAEYPPDLSDELRGAVATVKYDRDRDAYFDVLGTEGAQGAIGYAFLAFLGPGDEVLITDPGYMHFGSGPHIAGACVRAVPLSRANNFRLDPDEVAAHLTPRTKMVVLCDPINPLGVIQTKEELLAIVRLCERRRIVVLNNMTHATHQINPSVRHMPVAALFRETCVDHAICITGLSKGYALAALRLGFMAGHPSLLRVAAQMKAEITGIHIHPFAQRAALAAISDRPYVARTTKILRRNLAHLRRTLDEVGEVRFVVEPQYGFCTCLDVSGTGVSAQELTVAFFRQGICVIAGDAFGENGATRYLRVNYSSPDLVNFERFRDALPRAIRDAQSGQYLSGVEAFYKRSTSDRAKKILEQLQRRVAPRTAVGTKKSRATAHRTKESTMRNDPVPSFVSRLQLQYGPLDVLGKFFNDAYAAARSYGVHVTFGTFNDLLEVNLANQASWRALIPTFDPRFSNLDPQSSFCLLGYNKQGEVVATQACRLFTWTDTNFFEAARNLTLYYSRPDRDRRAGEKCDVTAESARNIRGRVAFSGGAWYRPDFRGKFLSLILPRVSRAYAFTRWSTDYTASMFQDGVLAGGMAQRCGYKNIDWEVHVKGSPMGDIKFAFVWMEPGELIEDLADFSDLMTAQVHRQVRHGRAKKELSSSVA